MRSRIHYSGLTCFRPHPAAEVLMSWGGWLGAGWGGRRLCCCLVPGPGSRNLESSVAGADAPAGRGAAWAPHSFCLSQLPQGGRTAAVRKQAVSLSGAFTVVLCSHSHFPAAPTLLSPGDRWSVLPNVVWGTSCKWDHSARNPGDRPFTLAKSPGQLPRLSHVSPFPCGTESRSGVRMGCSLPPPASSHAGSSSRLYSLKGNR